MMPTDQRRKQKNHPRVAEKIKESLCRLVGRLQKHKSHYKDKNKVKYLSPGVYKIDAYQLWTEEWNNIELFAVPSWVF